MDGRIERIRDEVLERAWLYPDPKSFRDGVVQAAEAMSAGLARPEPTFDLDASMSLDLSDPSNCHECRIPFDDDADSVDESLCPWCGARRPEPLQELVWAELKVRELAWPESVGA